MTKIISSDTTDFEIVEAIASYEDGCDMFVVHRHEGSTNERFYLKVFPFENLKQANKVLKMAVTMAAVRFNNGITFEDVFLHIEGNIFNVCVVTEYLKRSLYDVVHSKEVPKTKTNPLADANHQIREWSRELASSLCELHSKEEIHGNFDLHNIFLDSENNLRIGCYGLAKLSKTPPVCSYETDILSLARVIAQLTTRQVFPDNMKTDSSVIPGELVEEKDFVSRLLAKPELETLKLARGGSQNVTPTKSVQSSQDITRRQLNASELEAARALLARAGMADGRFRMMCSNETERYNFLFNAIMKNLTTKFVPPHGVWGIFKADRLVGVSIWANSDSRKKLPLILMIRKLFFADGVNKANALKIAKTVASVASKGFKKMKSERYSMLMYMGVDPEFQGQGYGSLLLSQILEWSDHEKLPVLTALFDKENVLGFFKKNGFQIVSSKKKTFGEEELFCWTLHRAPGSSILRKTVSTSSGEYLLSALANSRSSNNNNTGVRVVKDIVIDCLIGSGNFGEVYRGKWQGTTAVALKKLKHSNLLNEFLAEAQVLQELEMPLIVRFFGIFSDTSGSFYMVTEFMSKGNLRDFLEVHEKELKPLDLLLLCRDSAGGMKYMASRGFVHRDLAARNLLVKEEDGRFIVKIADFGLARLVETNYYAVDSPLPIRWCAPEALVREKFSTKSDVWAFGVVMWEIFEFGKLPYHGSSNKEASDMVLKGYRLPRPSNCPDSVYKLILACWEELPENRPQFEEIYDSLVKEIKGMDVSETASIFAAESPIPVTEYEERSTSVYGNAPTKND